MSRRVIGAALALLLAALACEVKPPDYTPSPPQMTAGALNATYEARATQTAEAKWTDTPTGSPSLPATTSTPGATSTSTPSPRPPATQTPTKKPTSSIVELPTLGTGTYVYEVTPETGGVITDADIRALAGLCVVEVRGLGDKRDAACASVVSTVFERMERHELSDGTVKGTITYGCAPGVMACQFPAFVAQGCKGIQPAACPDNYPETVTHFTIVVYEYLRLRALTEGGCFNYFYYGNQPFDRGGCEIAGPGGIEGFHE